MTRGEEINKKAYEISQRCFPDSQNIWARPNIEAQLVQSACCEMAKWADENPKKGLISIDKVCELLKKHIIMRGYEDVKIEWIEQFRKIMEE